MNPETINTTYELISNPILRLLIYFLCAAIAAMGGVIVYLYREIVAMNKENIAALNNVADALDRLRETIEIKLTHNR